jgi:2-succinyl-5-enolpyruvyl-6-hydroxy-3-cyclohexene-1-carboxylate synthase
MKWGWDFNHNLRDDDGPQLATSRGSNKLARLRASEDVDSEQGLNITVRNAMGGKIITFRTYDHKTDRHNYRLYVIPDDMDFNVELCKMITLESMRG